MAGPVKPGFGLKHNRIPASIRAAFSSNQPLRILMAMDGATFIHPAPILGWARSEERRVGKEFHVTGVQTCALPIYSSRSLCGCAGTALRLPDSLWPGR